MRSLEKSFQRDVLTQSKSLVWIVRKLNQSPHLWVSTIEIFLKHYAFLAAFKMQRGHSCSSLRAEVENYLRDLWVLMGSVTSIPGCLCKQREDGLTHNDRVTLPVRAEQQMCIRSTHLHTRG